MGNACCGVKRPTVSNPQQIGGPTNSQVPASQPAAPKASVAPVQSTSITQPQPAFNSAQPAAPVGSSNLLGGKNAKDMRELSMVFSQVSQSQIDGKAPKTTTVQTNTKDLTAKDRVMLGATEKDQIRAFNVEYRPNNPEYLIKDSNYFDESDEEVVRSKFNVNKSSTDLNLASYHIGSTKAVGTGQIKSFMFDREVQVS